MSSNRKVKFVEVDTTRGGLPAKRRQVQHACASCRRKKVRLDAPTVSVQAIDARY